MITLVAIFILTALVAFVLGEAAHERRATPPDGGLGRRACPPPDRDARSADVRPVGQVT